MSRKTFDERSRRRFLSTTAAAAAGVTGMTAVGAAKKSPEEVIAKARNKFNQNKWDTDKYRKYLRKKGFNTPNLQGEVKIKKAKKRRTMKSRGKNLNNTISTSTLPRVTMTPTHGHSLPSMSTLVGGVMANIL